MTNDNRTRFRRGLSLLEVILAIAILGGALAVIGQLIQIGSRNAMSARDLTTAQLLCESKVNEVVAGIELPEPVTTAPLLDDPTGEWLYSVQVEPTDLEGLLSVSVTVEQDPERIARPLNYTLSRWMVDPEFAAGAAEQEATLKQAFADAKTAAQTVSGTTKYTPQSAASGIGALGAGGAGGIGGGQGGGGGRRGQVGPGGPGGPGGRGGKGGQQGQGQQGQDRGRGQGPGGQGQGPGGQGQGPGGQGQGPGGQGQGPGGQGQGPGGQGQGPGGQGQFQGQGQGQGQRPR